MKIEVKDSGERISISGTGSLFLATTEDFATVMTRSKKAIEKAKDVGFDEGVAFEFQHAKERRQDCFDMYCRGQNHSSGCGLKGDAEIIALAIRGVPLKQILQKRFTYNKEGHKRPYKRDKIYRALSVAKPDDRERIEQLYVGYPSVFEGITYEELMAWYWKRYGKNGKRGGKDEN